MATTLTGLLLKAGHQARAQDLFMMSHPAKVTIYTSVPKAKPPVREQATVAILYPQVLGVPVSHSITTCTEKESGNYLFQSCVEAAGFLQPKRFGVRLEALMAVGIWRGFHSQTVSLCRDTT